MAWYVLLLSTAEQKVWPDYTLGDVLKQFKQGRSHLGLVRDVNNSGKVNNCGFQIFSTVLEGVQFVCVGCCSRVSVVVAAVEIPA